MVRDRIRACQNSVCDHKPVTFLGGVTSVGKGVGGVGGGGGGRGFAVQSRTFSITCRDAPTAHAAKRPSVTFEDPADAAMSKLVTLNT